MPPHFEYSRLGDVIAPHWAYVLVFGLIAAIPWLRLHYSLRTLLSELIAHVERGLLLRRK